MSPEAPKNIPETQVNKPYVLKAKEVVGKVSELAPEITERFEVVDAYVDQLLEAAAEGKVTGSAGVYTKEQLLAQFKDFLADESKRLGGEDIDPYRRIPGVDGMRTSFEVLFEGDETRAEFRDSLEAHIEAHERKRAELLSPENIEEMGEVEVSSAGIQDPMAEASRISSQMIAEQGPQAETELQMNERFLRESQAELKDLYARHRAAKPGSYEAESLVNQINNAKEDVGKFGRIVAKLKGSNVWH